VPFSDLVKIWNRFWFSEGSPLPVAFFRIFFGILVLANFLALLPDLYEWFGKNSWVSAKTHYDWTGMSGLSVLNFFPGDDNYLTICVAIFVLAAIGLTVGFRSRLCCLICFLGVTSLYHRNLFILNSGDSFMRVTLCWLIFAASGNALSVDNWLRRKQLAREGLSKAQASTDAGPDFDNYKAVSNWPLRLLQLQLALVYCHTFYKKFWGAAWYDGNAVYFSSRVEDLQRFPMPFVFDHMWTINILTFGTLALEFALFTLIWIKETRYWVIAGAVCFHLIIDYHMNIPFFEYLMISAYILFIEPSHLAWFLRFLKAKLFKTSQTSLQNVDLPQPEPNLPGHDV
jgi:hypothetical protein